MEKNKEVTEDWRRVLYSRMVERMNVTAIGESLILIVENIFESILQGRLRKKVKWKMALVKINELLI